MLVRPVTPKTSRGAWLPSHLTAGDHGLISEAVAPGFDYRCPERSDIGLRLLVVPDRIRSLPDVAPVTAGRTAEQ
ncbi:hypothetical protein EES43_23050 [Streptomyces sp. ADI96-02]|nr:hypothetical protein EES43_23050 [Streptomyces sp. ADI96-02]